MSSPKNLVFLLVFLCSLVSKDIVGQEYLFDIQHISLKDGLSNRQTYTLRQDTFGNIWGNGPGILFRYDGYTFQTFGREDLNIIGEDYPTFGIDDEGLVWFRAIGVPLQILNPVTKKVQNVEDFLEKNDIETDIATKKFITSKKFLPVSTEEHVIQFQGYEGDFYRYKNHQFKLVYKHYQPIGFRKINQNQDFVFYKKDTLFTLLPNGTIDKQLTPKSLAHLKIFNNTIYIGYQPDTGVSLYSWFEMTDKKIAPLKFPKEEWKTNGIQDFVVDNLGYKWLISGEEVAKETIVCISPEGEIVYNQPLVVSNRISDLRELFIDKQNNIWITSTEGLFRITRRKIPFIKYFENKNPRGIIRIDDKILIAHSRETTQIEITSKKSI